MVRIVAGVTTIRFVATIRFVIKRNGSNRSQSDNDSILGGGNDSMHFFIFSVCVLFFVFAFFIFFIFFLGVEKYRIIF